MGIVNSYLCAHDYVGGIVGRNGTGSVINCYNTGTVIGQNKIGGIAGYSYSTIQNCYNTGAVSYTHLDVYKRQVLIRRIPILGTDGMVDFLLSEKNKTSVLEVLRYWINYRRFL